MRKRNSKDWFTENSEEIDSLLEIKRHLFQNTLTPNLSDRAKEEAAQAHKDFQSATQKRMREIQNQWWLNKAQEAQLPADTKNSKAFYNLLLKSYMVQNNRHLLLLSQKMVQLFLHNLNRSRQDGVSIIKTCSIATQLLMNLYLTSLSNVRHFFPLTTYPLVRRYMYM